MTQDLLAMDLRSMDMSTLVPASLMYPTEGLLSVSTGIEASYTLTAGVSMSPHPDCLVQ